MRTLPIARKLPRAIAYDIGRVTYAYSLLEHILRTTVYLLIEVDPKQGRLAVKDARGKEMVDLIRDLMYLDGERPAKEWWEDLRDAVESVRTERDQYAHGIWLHDRKTKQFLLRVTRGNWQPKGRNRKVSRRILPEGVPYSAADFRALLKKTTELDPVGRTTGAGLLVGILAAPFC